MAKLVDVVGLYTDPPENASVICVDEKTQVQALDRSQPLLPMRPGQIERRAHDYKRNGTVQLYASLEVQAGKVIPRLEERHRSKEFLAFIDQSLRHYTQGELHTILGNVSCHHSQELQKWHHKKGKQRVIFHPSPTYSSWPNLVEIFFNLLQAKVIRGGTFPLKRDMVGSIQAYIERFNQAGHIFRWAKAPDVIISSLNNVTRRYSSGALLMPSSAVRIIVANVRRPRVESLVPYCKLQVESVDALQAILGALPGDHQPFPV